MIITNPQTTTEVSRPTVIVINHNKPVLIICEATCDTSEICDPILRLDIPSPTCNTDGGTIYLPETDTSKLDSFSFNYVSRKTNNVSVTEFNIIPKTSNFHGAFATCELRIQHSPDLDSTTPVTYSLGYVLVFNSVPSVACLAGSNNILGGPLIASILLILTLLVTVPIIGYFLVRYRKKATPIGEQNSLVVKVEDNNIIEDEVKQKETCIDTVQNNGSLAQEKLDYKLPDTITSRDN